MGTGGSPQTPAGARDFAVPFAPYSSPISGITYLTQVGRPAMVRRVTGRQVADAAAYSALEAVRCG